MPRTQRVSSLQTLELRRIHNDFLAIMSTPLQRVLFNNNKKAGRRCHSLLFAKVFRMRLSVCLLCVHEVVHVSDHHSTISAKFAISKGLN